MQFTTSWDDGFQGDLRVAEMLDSFGMKGTFYVSPHPQDHCTMLTEEEVRALSRRHEIGAHTMHHPHLTQLKRDQASLEISQSKTWVEQVTGKECPLFCYPYGDTNPAVRDLVEQAGFRGARTTAKFAFRGNDPFLLPTSIVLNPFPFRPIANRRFVQPLQRAWPHLRALSIPLLSCRSWLPMAKAVFHYAVETKQPRFHLLGHSNDIERYQQWGVLQSFLQYVHEQKNIEYVVNAGLL